MVGTGVRPPKIAFLTGPALSHCDKRRGKIRGHATCEARMYTDCRVEIVVCCPHDRGGGRSGRQPTNIDALSINQIVIHDLARNARDKRGFTSAALLVGCAKPVPAFRLVCLPGLSRIDHEAILLLSDKIHPRAGGKIIRRLGTAVKHDDQRKRLLLIAARDEKPVGTASRGTAVHAFDEPGALRHDVRCGQRGALRHTSQSDPGAPLFAIQ